MVVLMTTVRVHPPTSKLLEKPQTDSLVKFSCCMTSYGNCFPCNYLLFSDYCFHSLISDSTKNESNFCIWINILCICGHCLKVIQICGSVVRTPVKKVMVGAYDQLLIRCLETALQWYFCSASAVYISAGADCLWLLHPVSQCVNGKSSTFRVVVLLLLAGWF